MSQCLILLFVCVFWFDCVNLGGSLFDYLSSLSSKGQRMSEEQIWPIFIQLSLALCYMHCEKRVVHRDLTPQNIMIDHRKRIKISKQSITHQMDM